MNKFEHEGKKYEVRKPNAKDLKAAENVKLSAFHSALKAGAIIRDKLNDYLKDQGVWDDEKQTELVGLQNNLLENEKKLAQGGIRLQEAKKLAIQMRMDRLKMFQLISPTNKYDENTADAKADDAYFDYLLSACLVYDDTKKLYFKNLDDYLERHDDPVALKAANILAREMSSFDENFEANLPENKFLVEFNMVDSELRLIDADGDYVDIDGNKITKDGVRLNDKGETVDSEGNPIDAEGNFTFERQPFLDDNDEPIKPKRRRATSKAK